MPANRSNYIVKLVSADQLVKYQPVANGSLPATIVTQCLRSLRANYSMSDPLDTVQTVRRTYQMYDRTFRADLRCFIVEYREVL